MNCKTFKKVLEHNKSTKKDLNKMSELQLPLKIKEPFLSWDPTNIVKKALI